MNVKSGKKIDPDRAHLPTKMGPPDVSIAPKLKFGSLFRVAAANEYRQPRILRKPRISKRKLALHERRTAVGLDHAPMHTIPAEPRIGELAGRRYRSSVISDHEIRSDQ